MTNKRKVLGQYPTPIWVSDALVARHFSDLDENDIVIDPACGPGSFLSAIPDHVPAVGIEIDAAIADEARQTGRHIITGDFQQVQLDFQPTVIIGNPPFNMKTVDGFLHRAHKLLPDGGRVGFILPAYAFQTAARVAGYANEWSLMQEMIPRNIYPGLSLPLVFAMFSKDRRRTMLGFALYREATDVQALPQRYREVMSSSAGPVWKMVVEEAMKRLGGKASVTDLYAEIEGERPTSTKFWREAIRRTLRRYAESFEPIGHGLYRIAI